jgi:iron(III) transport system substrate-binding protein
MNAGSRFPRGGRESKLVALAISAVFAAYSNATAAEADDHSISAQKRELIQAAQKDGQINILLSGFTNAAFLQDIEDAMNAEYGTTIRITGTGGPNMSQAVTRLIQEYQAKQPPSTDLLYTSTRQRAQLQQAGVTEPVDWKKYEPNLQPEEMTGDSSGLILFADRVGVVYNVNSIPSYIVPKTIDDLADPKYRGKLATTPYGSGFGDAIMLFGAERVLKVVDGMAHNIIGFTASTDFRPIITDEFPLLAFTASSSAAILEKEKGAPIDVAYPFQAYTQYSIDMLKRSPHPNAARLFALFLHLPKGQAILWQYRRQDSPFIPTSYVYKQVQEARNTGQPVLLYTEADVKKYGEAFTKLVPMINRKFRSR